MNDTTPQVVHSYLAQLEFALGTLPAETRADIVAGIREELVGLDAAASAARIEELGDPAFIAAEAAAALPATSSPSELTSSRSSGPAGSRWLAVLAVLLVAVGGIVLPIFGSIIGLVLVAASDVWTRSEKIYAILVPIVLPLLIVLVSSITSSLGMGVAEDSVNPLLPGITWHAVIVAFPVLFADGIWLLWRAQRRGWQRP